MFKTISYQNSVLKHVFALLVTVVACLAMVSSSAQSATAPKILLGEYLTKVGVKLDCYFTIETDQRTRTSLIYVSDTDVESVESLIKVLKLQLPNVAVQQNKDITCVIDLIDQSLVQQDDYTLAKDLKLSYRGMLSSLPKAIGKKLGGNLSEQYPTRIPIIFSDPDTKIAFDSTARVARNLLSLCIPFSQYPRVVWMADTKMGDGFLKTSVFYSSIMVPREPGTLNPVVTKNLDFSLGEPKFRNSLFSDQLVTDAIAFVNERMTGKSQLNVRWAMFYLGKYKVGRGVPTLLKYIDYKYTTTPLVEEAYPALRALRQIGKPASDAALAALTAEKDAKHLRLLLRVVMSVNGLEGGQKIVRAALPNINNVAQRQTVAATLKTVVAQIPHDSTATVPDEDDEEIATLTTTVTPTKPISSTP